MTTIELLLDDGHQIDVASYEGTWLDVGRPRELLEANELAFVELDDGTENVGTVEYGVHLHSPVVIEKGVRLQFGAYVERPALIRSGAEVRSNTYIRGHGCRAGRARW